jgi:hypothetical protein
VQILHEHSAVVSLVRDGLISGSSIGNRSIRDVLACHVSPRYKLCVRL